MKKLELKQLKMMENMKYKVGDKVLIKKDLELHRKHLEGKTATISHIEKDVLGMDYYRLAEDKRDLPWDKAMFECLVERNGKTYPYKIGDRVVLKGNNRCATITDLKYNSWGNLSYYVRIDNDKDISIDYPTDLLLPYDNKIEESVEKETKPKMVNLDDVCEWVEKHIFDFPWYDNEQGDFSSKDVANALRKAMEE